MTEERGMYDDKTITWDEVLKHVEEEFPQDTQDEVIDKMNVWLKRGDGIAIYQNHDLGHPMLGHRQIVSYGSEHAQLEVDEPPYRLPDIGNQINWRYVLVGTYRGEELPR
jgi:hypothetical protein